MVQVVRANYADVWFVIPDKAMSAGTVFVMSGDEILMDSFSVLGPIDPQVPKKIDGELKLVPALAYLSQFERLIAKSSEGKLTTAEFALLQSFDLAELQQFEEARELSVELLRQWLARYKFKNWTATKARGLPVTPEQREKRAEEIARALSDHQRWHSHGRGISMEVLTADQPKGLNLRVTDFGANEALAQALRSYYDGLRDFFAQSGFPSFVHARHYF